MLRRATNFEWLATIIVARESLHRFHEGWTFTAVVIARETLHRLRACWGLGAVVVTAILAHIIRPTRFSA